MKRKHRVTSKNVKVKERMSFNSLEERGRNVCWEKPLLLRGWIGRGGVGFTCKGLGSLTGREERGLFETLFEGGSSGRVRGMFFF